MIDITEFQSQQNSIDLKQFIDTCIKSVENGKDLLAKKFYFFIVCLSLLN
jgi:hypothetical protein